MSIAAGWWLAGGLALCGLGSGAGVGASPPPDARPRAQAASASTTNSARQAEHVTLRGRVVTMPAALDATKLGIRVDAEPIAKQVVLLGDDGTITPLFPDNASRALFLDERLRNRRAEIHGKRFAGVPYFQVVMFKIEQDGRLRTPEYYCNICTISVRFPQICPCCQGPMELRMKPERR